MRDRITAAFDEIHADKRMIRRTKAALRKNSFDYGREVLRMRSVKRRKVTCFAMLAAVLFSLGIYNIPTAVIDIDVNPSIELKVNAFDKVVKARGMNADGKRLIEEMKLQNLPYTQAVRRILLSKDMEQYMDGDEMLSITVVGGTLQSEEEFIRNVVCSASAVTKEENLYYCKTDAETAQAAKKAGLTVARYQALTELQKDCPSITAEDVLGMSMREIKETVGCYELEEACH